MNHYLILHGPHTSADISQSLYSTAELSDLWEDSRDRQHEAIHIISSNQEIMLYCKLLYLNSGLSG